MENKKKGVQHKTLNELHAEYIEACRIVKESVSSLTPKMHASMIKNIEAKYTREVKRCLSREKIEAEQDIFMLELEEENYIPRFTKFLWFYIPNRVARKILDKFNEKFENYLSDDDKDAPLQEPADEQDTLEETSALVPISDNAVAPYQQDQPLMPQPAPQQQQMQQPSVFVPMGPGNGGMQAAFGISIYPQQPMTQSQQSAEAGAPQPQAAENPTQLNNNEGD